MSSRLGGSRAVFDEYRCAVCDELLDGREPYWVVAYPKSAHARCVDWSTRSFPFARQLKLLRRAWKETTDEDARKAIAGVGRWLAELERRWRRGERRADEVTEASRRFRELAALAAIVPRLKDLA